MCHREEGKSSRELFEQVRVNAPFLGGIWDFAWVLRPLNPGKRHSLLHVSETGRRWFPRARALETVICPFPNFSSCAFVDGAFAGTWFFRDPPQGVFPREDLSSVVHVYINSIRALPDPDPVSFAALQRMVV